MSTAFQYENVIFPDNEPVLLVNRDWEIPGRKARKSSRKSGSQGQVAGGTLHTFRIKVKAEPPKKVQLQQSSSASTSRTKRSTTSAQSGLQLQSSKASGRQSPASLHSSGGRTSSEQERHMSGSPSSDESSTSDGELFEATVFDMEDYSLIPTARVQAAQPAITGIDACLLQLANYEMPAFIPKGIFLNYYVSSVADFMYPLKGMYRLNPLMSIWLPIVLVDELWFYCVMYTVARHLHASNQTRSYERESTYLADLLLQKLRKRLETHAAGEGLTDVDCAAVACLLGIEHAFGSKEGAHQHALGLASFVNKRGGVRTISNTLRTKICRADVECAIDHGCVPALPEVPYAESLAVRLRLPEPPAFLEEHPSYNVLLRHLSEPLALIAVDFLSLVDYLNRETGQTKPLDPFLLDDSVLSIQHRLARLQYEENAPLDYAFRAACLVFIKCLIKRLNTVSQTSAQLMIEVQQNIERCEAIPQPLLLWLLYMGLIAGPPLHEERILLSSRLVDDMKLEHGTFPNWTYFKEQLRQVAWVDAILDRVGESISTELEAVALV